MRYVDLGKSRCLTGNTFGYAVGSSPSKIGDEMLGVFCEICQGLTSCGSSCAAIEPCSTCSIWRCDSCAMRCPCATLSHDDFASCIHKAANEISDRGLEGLEDSPAFKKGNNSLPRLEVKNGCGRSQCMAMYGRTLTRPFHDVMTFVQRRHPQVSVFVDIGSGLGIQAMQAAACFGMNSRGVEIMRERSSQANKLFQHFVELLDLDMQEKMAHVSLTWDDFTRAAGPSGDQELLSFLLGGTDNAKGTSAPSLIFCNNAEDVFGPRSRKIGHRSLDQQLAELLC